jgi:hypothetical protein
MSFTPEIVILEHMEAGDESGMPIKRLPAELTPERAGEVARNFIKQFGRKAFYRVIDAGGHNVPRG